MTSRIDPPASPPPSDPAEPSKISGRAVPLGESAQPDDDELLACGKLLSQVWADWEDGNPEDEHSRSCPHCLGAVEELEHLETVVRELDHTTDDPEPYDATSLTQRVMDVVRAELRPGRPLPLAPPPEDLWIMESAAARTLRAAAEQVPGVRAGSCRIDPDPDREAAQVAIRLGIQVWLSAPGMPDLPSLADEVRVRVEYAADRHLGLRLDGIDVHITELVDGIEEGTVR